LKECAISIFLSSFSRREDGWQSEEELHGETKRSMALRGGLIDPHREQVDIERLRAVGRLNANESPTLRIEIVSNITGKDRNTDVRPLSNSVERAEERPAASEVVEQLKPPRLVEAKQVRLEAETADTLKTPATDGEFVFEDGVEDGGVAQRTAVARLIRRLELRDEDCSSARKIGSVEVWTLYRLKRANERAHSKHNLSRSFATMRSQQWIELTTDLAVGELPCCNFEIGAEVVHCADCRRDVRQSEV